MGAGGVRRLSNLGKRSPSESHPNGSCTVDGSYLTKCHTSANFVGPTEIPTPISISNETNTNSNVDESGWIVKGVGSDAVEERGRSTLEERLAKPWLKLDGQLSW